MITVNENDKTTSSHSVDFHFKAALLIRIIFIAAFCAFSFALMYSLNINNIGIIHSIVDYIFAASSIVLAFRLKQNSQHFNWVLNTFLTLCFITSLSALIYVPEDTFRVIWFFLLMLVAFMFGGSQLGYAFTLSSMLVFIITNSLVEFPFNTLTLLSILASLVVMATILASFTTQMNKYIQQLDKQNIELIYLANKDPLTEVLSSKLYNELGKSLLLQLKKNQDHLSLLYLNIDHFTQVNNKFGRQVGDQVLKHIIKQINLTLKSQDIIAFINGGEFCILLPYRDNISALNVAKKINQLIQTELFSHQGNKIPLTISIGISTLQDNDEEIRSLQIRADKALVKAKSLGGNVIKSV
ncbi:MAG: GGDEF domain-containing protein [Colwellia sp.]|nr:GGDEF domain-containing protein [Colwellia sp.]